MPGERIYNIDFVLFIMIWADLYNSFGQPKFIFKDIEEMISRFSSIKSKEDISKIKEEM